MTKGKAYAICLIAIMVIFLSVFVLVACRESELTHIPVAACLTALSSLTGLFFTQSVINNGVKGRNWSQEMWDSENSEKEEEPEVKK